MEAMKTTGDLGSTRSEATPPDIGKGLGSWEKALGAIWKLRHMLPLLPPHLHAPNSDRVATRYEPYNNSLRTTEEAHRIVIKNIQRAAVLVHDWMCPKPSYLLGLSIYGAHASSRGAVFPLPHALLCQQAT
jgi:hypothetical protein